MEIDMHLRLQKLGGFHNTFISYLAIPSTVVDIEQDAFRDYHALAEIHFQPNSQLTKICGFLGLPLPRVTIPDLVTIVRGFRTCQLTEVFFGENSQLARVEPSSAVGTSRRFSSAPIHVCALSAASAKRHFQRSAFLTSLRR
jgi:hypothetical protein